MKKIKIIMASAFILAIGGAFATKSIPDKSLNVTGFKQSGASCVSNISVACHNSDQQTCVIDEVSYFRNTACASLARD